MYPCRNWPSSASLLPGMLRGEDEYVVIGGLYRVRLARF
jgi:hypothetical protein